MTGALKNLIEYRELMVVLAWKNIAVRYQQSYMGILWAVLKPIVLVLIFMVLRSFVGIDSGDIPYPVLTYSALTIWIFFQESASEGVSSVVGNANLIRKIYFPREVFPLTSVITKLVELVISLFILAGLMAWYGIAPSWQLFWVPLLVLNAVLAALTIAFIGAALNVYYRDIATALPVLLSLIMYMSPVIYPLALVKDKLLVQQSAGEWSGLLYTLFTLNPLAGLIDAFQNVTLRGLPPDAGAMMPGMVLTLVLLPFSYLYFKRAESFFADVI
ncbi:MAG: ABC transporter permease [Sulfuricellaceae bacterium]|nr:ABC transporter permease [Sulfuricellaceae bacterium]